MNERIRKLAEQCWDERPEGQLHFDNEKFAELVIQECAKIADEERPNSIGCGYITKTKGMKIREYFGVKE